MQKPPIFVVGAPRSGTTLLAAMLAAHSRLSCGTETRFFRFLPDPDELCDPRSWPDRAIEYLCSIPLVNISVPEHFGINREQMQGYLSARSPTTSTILAALTEQHMWREQKCRWVEKSPEHLLYVQTIRKYFPQSPIVRIIRDPRDAALSMVKAPWGPKNFVEALFLWQRYDERSAPFFHADDNSYTLSYEQLVQTPEVELRKLCTFLGEAYEAQMLDTSQSAANVVTEKDAWHRIVDKPVDKSRIHVWKRTLSVTENRMAEALLGEQLTQHGYETVEQFAHTATVYPSFDTLGTHQRSFQLLVENNNRLRKIDQYAQADLVAYIGNPDRDHWLRHTRWARLLDFITILGRLLQSRVLQKQVIWVCDQSMTQQSGYAVWIFVRVFRLIGNYQTP